MASRREPHNFSSETKLESLRRYDFRCANCGKHKKDCKPKLLELHHRLPISIALDHFPHAVFALKSVENCIPLCRECHKEVHEDLTIEECAIIAQALLGMLTSSGD
jgi:5-methylcytosine-specific restriction endonuclease McrA